MALRASSNSLQRPSSTFKRFLKQGPVQKIIAFILFVTIGIFSLQFNFKNKPPSLIRNKIENIRLEKDINFILNDPFYTFEDFKYILLWTPQDIAPFYYLGLGRTKFVSNNCTVQNCFVTTNRYLFKGDLSKFDAIAFNGRHIEALRKSDLPKHRWPHQKYIFMNMESCVNYPVCSDVYDNFFNWTSTYRLDSDIPYPYILIRNRTGDKLGPKRDMNWTDCIEDEFPKHKKRKAAAWFVSNCASASKREKYVARLQDELSPYKLNVDIYGGCGSLSCPRDRNEECYDKLKNEYFFYLAMENSFAEDYVTEKLLTAVQNKVVPIVYGGANYLRFLPPGSYLDARKHTPEDLASIMNSLINNLNEYNKYLIRIWPYSYHDPTQTENVCALCCALHNKTMLKTTVYKEFRKWWNPNFEAVCRG